MLFSVPSVVLDIWYLPRVDYIGITRYNERYLLIISIILTLFIQHDIYSLKEFVVNINLHGANTFSGCFIPVNKHLCQLNISFLL